ncbi:GAF domain-containing protein [Liquorilactobacillus mali]|uniref:GAF domain-containing protein n=1 Tax=Liquorilactobacillus mali TaxID=1618 RepID=UPI0023508B4C|nr:GAF domain-containing protein [Liquorilactobacillus mali]MDC7952843.1 GAF domain-containing protein [Liquorilactobacillus mali]
MSNTEKNYQLLVQQAQALLEGEEDLIANMSNMVSLIFNSLREINGATYYRFINNELILGPFQGKPACMHIAVGAGVCGTVAKIQETVIVPNVHEFKGHIACDAASKSEIVVPVFNNNTFWGVLDLDSPEFNTFNEIDKKYLEQIAPLIFGAKTTA